MLAQGQELAALDFADIIGGPLIAVINAQAKAANVTSSFIQEMAFTKSDDGGSQTLQTVTFDFSQMLGSDDGMGSSGSTIRVPLLSLLPIPFIRVESMTVKFNATLHRTATVDLNNNFAFSGSDTQKEAGGVGASSKFKWNQASTFLAGVTNRNTYQNNEVLDDTYSLDVTVNAVQDQMPGGMAQILGIFGNLIQAQATTVQALMSQQVQAEQAQLNGGAIPGIPSIPGAPASPAIAAPAATPDATAPAAATPDAGTGDSGT